MTSIIWKSATPVCARNHTPGKPGSYLEPFKSGFLDFISLSADTYYNKVKDKIVAVPTMFVWKMSNVGKVETIGVDVNLSAECRLNQQMKLYLTGNYNFMQAEDVTDRNSKTWRNQIVYTPRHSGSGSLTLETPGLT
mgnify:CR=1 FL=1